MFLLLLMEQSQLVLRTAEVSEKSMLGLRTFSNDVVPQAADEQLSMSLCIIGPALQLLDKLL